MARKRTTSKTAVAYIRVSTDRERQDLGADAQRAAIERWAGKNGVRVVAWHLDEVSGGAALDRRPGLVAALADVEARKAGALIVQRLDRFSRDTVTAALAERELQRAGAVLVCADGNGNGDDPTGQLVRAVLLAVAQFEKAMIGARIRAALAVKQRRGEMTGAPRYGYRLSTDGVRVEQDAFEQEVIGAIRQLHADGLSVRGIVDTLAVRGIVGRVGKPLTRTAVHNILVRCDA